MFGRFVFLSAKLRICKYMLYAKSTKNMPVVCRRGSRCENGGRERERGLGLTVSQGFEEDAHKSGDARGQHGGEGFRVGGEGTNGEHHRYGGYMGYLRPSPSFFSVRVTIVDMWGGRTSDQNQEKAEVASRSGSGFLSQTGSRRDRLHVRHTSPPDLDVAVVASTAGSSAQRSLSSPIHAELRGPMDSGHHLRFHRYRGLISATFPIPTNGFLNTCALPRPYGCHHRVLLAGAYGWRLRLVLIIQVVTVAGALLCICTGGGSRQLC